MSHMLEQELGLHERRLDQLKHQAVVSFSDEVDLSQ